MAIARPLDVEKVGETAETRGDNAHTHWKVTPWLRRNDLDPFDKY